LIPLLVLAACSDTAEADQKAKAADLASLKLASGQWETTREILNVTAQDTGKPVLTAAEKTTVSNCVGEAEGKRPPAQVLAGMTKCSYDNLYMSRGRITAGMSCSQEGLSGSVLVSSEGKYASDSFETNANIQTYLTTDGDARAVAKISGKRVGACTPPKAV
jgi:hypothetical protein